MDNRLIALRKGVRECTKRPLYNFLAYEKLSSQFKAFISAIDNQIMNKDIQETLSIPQ